ncbi:hypothetical protein F5B19DRAFT_471116 [Rostrohypoxylon terebratum]|nr:hypothetical protein F5B19DRAFT_471116 [Rostrohypoxylon terebratum]
MSSAISRIHSLHAEATEILQPAGRSPTRAERAIALELADAAVDLAIGASLNQDIVTACTRFQQSCYGSLKKLYSQTAGYERFVYNKSSTKASTKARRGGRVYNTDPGEHLVEALQAVRLDEVLQNQNHEISRAQRTIRWSDQ